jgi:hypothetical protein
LFGYTAVMPVAVPKKKRSLTPLLTVVFMVSYALMTMLIVEQGAVIQSQRNLIKILTRDSAELWGMRGKAIADQQTAQAKAQGSAQLPSVQAPSTQAAPQHQSQSHAGRTAKPQAQRPPVPTSDLADQRRVLRTI